MMWLGERVHMGLLPIGSANMRDLMEKNFGDIGQGGGRCQWKTWLHMKVHLPIVFKKMRRSWFCVDDP
ncbi:unnamed protein product [Triticum turgidum subsp. durum]|uniref:Uncharacterized protein n=1 Tax=Triticum turgidum subsp. durum TaxID=4567 RepID=A0A9R1R6X1_TRITD|nr:unnamed protein product [Triticum turgidum subsp. durum]